MSRRKRDFRWVKWLLFLILIVVAAVAVILVKNNFDGNVDNDGRQTTGISKAEEKKSEEKIEQKVEDKKEETTNPEEKVPQYEGESPNKSETLTGMITYTGVTNDKLVIRVNIDQFLQTGNCKLYIIKDGKDIYNGVVSIQESVTTSTCDGFDIPTSQLVSGNAQIEIILESGGRSGKIVGEAYI